MMSGLAGRSRVIDLCEAAPRKLTERLSRPYLDGYLQIVKKHSPPGHITAKVLLSIAARSNRKA